MGSCGEGHYRARNVSPSYKVLTITHKCLELFHLLPMLLSTKQATISTSRSYTSQLILSLERRTFQGSNVLCGSSMSCWIPSETFTEMAIQLWYVQNVDFNGSPLMSFVDCRLCCQFPSQWRQTMTWACTDSLANPGWSYGQYSSTRATREEI